MTSDLAPSIPDPAIDVLCIGQATFDAALLLDHHPAPDEKTTATHRVCTGGGPAANAAIAIRRLGGTSALATRLGLDPFGRLHRAELIAEGVLTDHLALTSHPTPFSAILIKPDGKRAVINHSGDAPPLQPADLPLPLPPRLARVSLHDGHQPELSRHHILQSRPLGHLSVLDAGSVRPGTLLLAPLVDHLVASEKFARDHTRRRDPEEALEILAEIATVAIITLGERGLLWATQGRTGRLPALPVHATDTTGAGDAFHAAYALALARNLTFTEILRYATAVGALACTRPGARPALPTAHELQQFLLTQPDTTPQG